MTNSMPIAYYLPATGDTVFTPELLALVILVCVGLAAWWVLK